MMNFRKLEKSIVGTVNGKPFNITRTPETEKQLAKFQKENATTAEVLAYVKDSRSQEIAGSNKFLVYNPMTNEYFLTIDMFRSKHPIPQALVKFIEESFDKDIDFMPIIKAWARLLTNPRYNKAMGNYFAKYIDTTYTDKAERDELIKEGYDSSAAEKLATYQDIAITQEGLLATYKVARMVTWEYKMEYNTELKQWEKVKSEKYETIPAVLDPTTGEILEEAKLVKPDYLEDFLFTPAICTTGDKFFSGDKIGYVYQVGLMQYLPADAKRNLSNTFGGGGLYSGGLNYIEAYRAKDCHVLTCFVNPGDILSFQDDGHAFRTDAIFPNNVWDEEAILKGIYHSSDYDTLSSERLEAIITDAVHRDVDLRKEQEEINIARENGMPLSTEGTVDPDYVQRLQKGEYLEKCDGRTWTDCGCDCDGNLGESCEHCE
jgi:hypothetical protein